jgi:hypothetical protein
VVPITPAFFYYFEPGTNYLCGNFRAAGQRIREFDEQKRIEKEAKATIRVSKKGDVDDAEVVALA